jgi:ATP-dependent DNA helicase RecQ
MEWSMDALLTHLARFGHSGFRPGQQGVIEAILAGRPALAVMPTGGGKSLCYQLPSVALDGVTLVVSPLIALMKDQVDALRAKGIPAAFLNSSQSFPEQQEVLRAAQHGDLRLLYVAPERFRYEGARAALARLPLSLFVVDEAHCISQWGHDFRPEYRQLGAAARELQVPRIAAFTATATPRVQQDIISQLGLQDPLVVVAGFMRPNLRLEVRQVRRMTDKHAAIRAVAQDREGSVIVYCATRNNCGEVVAHLERAGIRASVYHGGLPDEERRRAHDAFSSDPKAVIVATNAFGMGIDKPNIRAVVHYDVPGSIEAYYQEAGRAGRDGEAARAILLFTYADTRYHEFFIQKGGEELSPEVRAEWVAMETQRLRQVVRYAYEEGCRHRAILHYFGEPTHGGRASCGVCDRCEKIPGKASVPRPSAAKPSLGADHERDLAAEEVVVVQKLLSAVARARGLLDGGEIVACVRGGLAVAPLAGTKSFGILREHPQAGLLALLEALAAAGCLAGVPPALTELGRRVMWNQVPVRLRADPIQPVAEPPPAARKRARRKTARRNQASRSATSSTST